MESFSVKTVIRIDRDLANGINQILEEEKSEAVLVFTNKHTRDHEQVRAMMEKIKENRKVELVTIPGGEPTTALVNEYADKYRDWYDWKSGKGMTVSIGGGAVMDFTKALSGMLVFEGTVERYQLSVGCR